MEVNLVNTVAFAVRDPKLITIDFEDLAQRHKERLKAQEKDAPPPSKADFRKEYNQLRQQLFDLQQNAKAFEIRTNDAAGKIRLLEERINNIFKLKKEAIQEGNLKGERTYERAIANLETELLDAQEEFNKNKRWSTQAARALRTFDGAERIAELKAILDTPLPVAKTDK